uniref:Sister chromatid cohesion protein DCC1 n=1 Tax=Daphnia lumholtzi TaxID=42856 RepID=A0A4Y7M6K4_9CRUS|nr:EOG090X09TV [Daphnia lumholtzi]SVE77732.1 EOG090X09TV [Daphnia lumholtzi]SVE78360.1 EOG090X09TV [Daphnia lumholtzi]SVE78989.1 EOG090X09TV [Daphnia lumholtzi]
MDRSLQQVNTMLNLAKLTESDIKKESHVLQFVPQILDSKLVKLIEVSKGTLEYINSGECLFLKGNEDDHVIICSNSNTFELKEAETSNSILLMPTLLEGKLLEDTGYRTLMQQKVFGVYHTYYEMRLTRPKLQSLRNALAKYPYKGKNSEITKEVVGLSFTELKMMIQASEEEIINQLQEMPAVKVRGKWRLLDVGFSFGWVSYLDSMLREKQLSLAEVTQPIVKKWMGLYDTEDINAKCIALFMEVDESSLRWKSEAVSQLFALYLLPELRAFDSKDFFTVWQQSMPVGVKTDEEHLNGVAIVDYDSTPSLVKYLPEFDLPEEINERLGILFRNRTKWTLQSITPYVQPLTDNNLNVAALLTKYARSSTVNGVKYYSSKY